MDGLRGKVKALSMVETVKARAEEIRGRVKTRITEIRGGKASEGLFSSPEILKGGALKGALATEIREKGLIAAARDRMGKLRVGKGLGSMFTSETSPSSPAAPATPTATMYPATAQLPERVDLMTKSRLY